MGLNIELVGLVILLIWLIILSIFFFFMQSHYNRLTKGVTSKDMRSVLNTLLTNGNMVQKDVDSLKSWCDRIEKDGLTHIQKIGLLRFNPFNDTGGDQSFILSFIDAKNTGVVISGLYSRSGTRWYAKKVVDGKGVEHELSEEEKKALKEAKTFAKV